MNSSSLQLPLEPPAMTESQRASLAGPATVRKTNDRPVMRERHASFLLDTTHGLILPNSNSALQDNDSFRYSYGAEYCVLESARSNFDCELFTPNGSIIFDDNSSLVDYTFPSEDDHNFANHIARTLAFLQEKVMLTAVEQKYVADTPFPQEKLTRLATVEQQRRDDICSAWILTKQMIELGISRVRPILRTQTSKLIAMKSVRHSFAAAGTPRSPPSQDIDSYLPPSQSSKLRSKSSEVPMQILKLTGNAIPHGQKSEPFDAGSQWDFLSLDGAAERLCRGELCFAFKCCAVHDLDSENDMPYVRDICGITRFQPGDPDYINQILWDNADATKDMTIVMVKTMYIAPGFDCTKLDAAAFSSLTYQKACQPGKPKFDESTFQRGDHTMRFTKTIVRFVFTVVIQLKVHEITDPVILQQFRNIDGIVPAKIILMERTKRDKTKVDSTVMMKSLLLYYPITGGTLICNFTNVVNKSVPGWIAKIVNSFGSSGMQEAAETATLTKAHLYKTYGDCRKR